MCTTHAPRATAASRYFRASPALVKRQERERADDHRPRHLFVCHPQRGPRTTSESGVRGAVTVGRAERAHHTPGFALTATK